MACGGFPTTCTVALQIDFGWGRGRGEGGGQIPATCRSSAGFPVGMSQIKLPMYPLFLKVMSEFELITNLQILDQGTSSSQV